MTDRHSPSLNLVIVGVGALGTEVTLRMVSDPEIVPFLGFLQIVDPDTIEQHNVPVSRLYTSISGRPGEGIVGLPKALVVAEHLRAHYRIAAEAHRCEIADVSWDQLRQADLLLSCTDNALARVETAFAARELGSPMLDSGVFGQVGNGGRVSWFAADRDAACYLCGLSEDRRAAVLTFASSASLGCRLPADTAFGRATAVVSSLERTAAAMIERVRRFVQADPAERRSGRFAQSTSVRLHATEGHWTKEFVALRRSLTCPWHESTAELFVSVDSETTFLSALDNAGFAGASCRIEFPWPMCLLARCRGCGFHDAEPRRLALVRRRACCPRCRMPHQLEPLRVVASVGHNDSVVNYTPQQLGWTDRQWLRLRPALVPVSGHREAL